MIQEIRDTKPTTDDLFAKLAELDVEILYFGDDREVQGAWLEEGAWVERVPWGDGEQRDIRLATDAEIIRALAAAMFGAATDAAANKAHTALGHAVAKVLPGAMAFDPRTAGEAQSWRMVRNEVTRLDQVARPGLTMGDDDIMPIVLRVLQQAARRPGREACHGGLKPDGTPCTFVLIIDKDVPVGERLTCPHCGVRHFLKSDGTLYAPLGRHSIPGPHEPDEDGVAECPNCTQSLTRGIRHLRKEDGTLSGMSREGLYCSECDDDWEPAPVDATPDDDTPF